MVHTKHAKRTDQSYELDVLPKKSLLFCPEVAQRLTRGIVTARPANNESSEVCVIIKPGRSVKLNRTHAVCPQTSDDSLFAHGQS